MNKKRKWAVTYHLVVLGNLFLLYFTLYSQLQQLLVLLSLLLLRLECQIERVLALCHLKLCCIRPPHQVAGSFGTLLSLDPLIQPLTLLHPLLKLLGSL